jgi:hypothetical protein
VCQGEEKSASRRVGLDETADIDIALGHHTIKRRYDPLIGLLLQQHFERRCQVGSAAGRWQPTRHDDISEPIPWLPLPG